MSAMAKDASMSIRVDAELLKSFVSACKDRDITASQVLRAAMRDFLERNPQPSLPLTKGKGKRNA
jgi:Ribbon-helix-helix protein, copG family.